MVEFINPGLVQTSRRGMLRGSMLAGAAAMVAGSAKAAPARRPIVSPRPHAPQFIQAQTEAQTQAAPVDLSGYTRVEQELVAPPFAPVHENVATGGPKIVEITMETQERLLTVDEVASLRHGQRLY